MKHFEPTYSDPRQSNTLVSFTARWVEALHGFGELADGIGELLRIVRADEAVVVRLKSQTLKAKRIASVGRQAGSAGPAIMAHSDELLGGQAGAMRPGTVWGMVEALNSGDLRLSEWLDRQLKDTGIREILIVAFEHRAGETDLLELHFRSAPADHNRALFITIAPELARCWQRRLPGIAQRSLFQPRILSETEEVGPNAMNPLSPGNPANLSRCEFRICMLIRDGMSVKVIAKALSNSEATVRAHMSAIYAKTEVSGQVELVHRLVSPSAGPENRRLARTA